MWSLDARRRRAASNPRIKCLSRVPSYGEKFDAILPDKAACFVIGPGQPAELIPTEGHSRRRASSRCLTLYMRFLTQPIWWRLVTTAIDETRMSFQKRITNYSIALLHSSNRSQLPNVHPSHG